MGTLTIKIDTETGFFSRGRQLAQYADRHARSLMSVRQWYSTSEDDDAIDSGLMLLPIGIWK